MKIKRNSTVSLSFQQCITGNSGVEGDAQGTGLQTDILWDCGLADELAGIGSAREASGYDTC